MGRVMAVDWGKRRVGIALSDESRTIASPHSVLERSRSLDRDLERIIRIIKDHGVSQVVFGLPVRLDGSSGPEAEGVREVADRLFRRSRIPVATWDERLSSVEAERVLLGGDVSRSRRRGLVDQVAASLILRSFLEHSAAEKS